MASPLKGYAAYQRLIEPAKGHYKHYYVAAVQDTTTMAWVVVVAWGRIDGPLQSRTYTQRAKLKRDFIDEADAVSYARAIERNQLRQGYSKEWNSDEHPNRSWARYVAQSMPTQAALRVPDWFRNAADTGPLSSMHAVATVPAPTGAPERSKAERRLEDTEDLKARFKQKKQKEKADAQRFKPKPRFVITKRS